MIGSRQFLLSWTFTNRGYRHTDVRQDFLIPACRNVVSRESLPDGRNIIQKLFTKIVKSEDLTYFFFFLYYIVIQGSKGHGMDACIRFYDVLTCKTRKNSHFTQKNVRLLSVLGFREHKVRRNPCIIGAKYLLTPTSKL